MLSLKDREWLPFKIKDIFEIKPGKRLTKADMTIGMRPFIGAIDGNNGITAFVSNSNESIDREILGVNYNGSVVETFYHPYKCVFSDDVKRFRLKNIMPSRYLYLFLKIAITQQKVKYAYGYKFNEKRMEKQFLLLPVADEIDNPDWQFMEDYIREREQLQLKEYMDHAAKILAETGGVKSVPPLKEKVWKPFYFSQVFSCIQRGKRLKTADHHLGNQPYVSSSSVNNGVNAFISNTDGVRVFNDCLTVANSGSIGSTFYHEYEFVASDHVTQLKKPDFSRYIYLFLAPVISRLTEKYSFNREISDKRINKEVLLLPVNSEEAPDWAYMEQYAKSIARQQLTSYLNYKNKDEQ